jgi:hypothetical protein
MVAVGVGAVASTAVTMPSQRDRPATRLNTPTRHQNHVTPTETAATPLGALSCGDGFGHQSAG